MGSAAHSPLFFFLFFIYTPQNSHYIKRGDAYMPDMPLDAIWIVFGGIQINPKGGKVIYITGDDLRKLTSYNMEENKRRFI